MAKDFILPVKTRFDTFRDNVSINDAETYRFNCTAWEEDNSEITSATWTVEYGQVAVSGAVVSSGVVSALLTFNSSGRSLVSILLNTATQKKKIWLEVYAKDKPNFAGDDYGHGD